ncbi:MAG: GNAT family N-acetyltransferase [Myxococcota bacterium]
MGKAAIRKAHPDEASAIDALVRAVIAETYPELFPAGAPPRGELTRWCGALVLVRENTIAGVGLAKRGWIHDLWLRRDARGQGHGTRLLARLEDSLRQGGADTARLRANASNTRATAFYVRRGYTAIRTYPHERHGKPMVDYAKPLDAALDS